MDAYSDFAYIYDALICEDINYDEMADYIEGVFGDMPRKPELVLDLACGTGSLTSVLARRGYDMIGLDISADMLSVAKEKEPDILYICQDMRAFELYGTVDAALCMTDSLNYVTSQKELERVFSLVKNYLNPDSPFIFDMNSAYKLEKVLGNNTFAYDGEDIFYVWENHWDNQKRICDFFMTFFSKGEDGLYRRFDETHTQRAYSCEEVENALRLAGFKHITAYDGYTCAPPQACTQRLVYVAY